MHKRGVIFLGKNIPGDWVNELKKCERLYPGFSDAVPFIKGVYDAADKYLKANPVKPVAVFDVEEAEEKARSGETINLNPNIDTGEAVGLLKALSGAIVKANPGLKETAKELNRKSEHFLENSPPEIGKADLIEFRDSLIKEAVLEKDLATFLFSFLLSSFYRQQLNSISEVLRTDLWEGGNCPLCGEEPHYGMLTPEDGAKQLECWLCGTEWLHTRIKCPFCDNEDHEKLGYFTADDSEICRVNYCQSCCQYYKVFDARKFHADGKIVLAIHNLATLAYDLLARKEGFTPGSRLEWVNDNELEKSDRQN